MIQIKVAVRDWQLRAARRLFIIPPMFTIEHDFDATVITLVDEGAVHLQEDVIIEAYEECVIIQQVDPETDEPMRITLSMQQARDLAAALNLPEGVYRLK